MALLEWDPQDAAPLNLEWDDTAMSGTNVRTSDAVHLRHKTGGGRWQQRAARAIYVQVPWTSTPTGAFSLQFAAEVDEDGDGDWDTHPAAVFTNNPDGSDGGRAWFAGDGIAARYVRLQYTNASDTGTLSDVVFNAKI